MRKLGSAAAFILFLAPVIACAGCGAATSTIVPSTPEPSWAADDGDQCFAAFRVIDDQWIPKWEQPFFRSELDLEHRSEYVALLDDMAAQIDAVRTAHPAYFDAAWSPIVVKLRSYRDAFKSPMTGDAFGSLRFETKNYVSDLFLSGTPDLRLDAPCGAIVQWVNGHVLR